MTFQQPTIRLLPYSYAKQNGLVLTLEHHSPTLIYHNLPSSPTLLEVSRVAGDGLVLKQVPLEEFEQILSNVYNSATGTAQQLAEHMSDDDDLSSLLQELPKQEDLLDSEDDAPIIRLLNALFTEALKVHASDIHIEPYKNDLQVRFRIDGVLRDIVKPQRVLAPMIVSRVKVMAHLDIAEKRLPQDGRISLYIAGRNVDVRVSTLPTNHGERIVMRLLDKRSTKLELSSLGMTKEDHRLINQMISEPHGILLITGPTGSGKTTTLYAALTQLNQPSTNILTIEDPIEYDLPGIGQSQVNTKVDMTFAKGLRAMLRQDPDIVMIGEIRDLETAEIAIQASLTGHFVLSTLHTNTAIGAVSRLVDMGVESFLLSTSLEGVIAQRLVRQLCEHCKQHVVASKQQLRQLGLDENTTVTIYLAQGCDHCVHTGYSGRLGIYEIIPIDDELRSMIHKGTSEQIMENYAHKTRRTIKQDGVDKVLAGKTTVDELLRVTCSDIEN